jgi:hypothetical protein
MKIFKINQSKFLRLPSYLLLIAFTFFVTSFSFAQAPVITSSAAISNVVNTAFGYSIVATNAPTSYSVTGTLPTGLSLNTTTGVISGTPSVVGVYNITFNAINASGTGSLTATITILPPPPVITSSGTANGVAGSAFSFSIIATNSPTGYTATGLPSGLSINTSTGVITGTVVTAGNYNTTITAANATGTSGPQALTIVICANTPVTISGTTTCLVPGPAATILTASPSQNYAWTASSGSFNSASGGTYVPATSVGYHSSANGTVTATYTTGGCTNTRTVSVSIAPPAPTVSQNFCTSGLTFTVNVANYVPGSTGKYELVYYNVGGAGASDFLVTTSKFTADASGNFIVYINPLLTATSQARGVYKLYYDDPICGLTSIQYDAITFSKTPVITISQTANCVASGQTSTITATPSAAPLIGSYTWTATSGTLSPTTGNTTTYTGTGNPATVTATYTDAAGCTSTASVNLNSISNIPLSPHIEMTSTSSDGTNVKFGFIVISPDPNVTYTWNSTSGNPPLTGTGTTFNLTRPLTGGLATVTCVATNGCGTSPVDPYYGTLSARPSIDNSTKVNNPVNYLIGPNPASNTLTIIAQGSEGNIITRLADNSISIEPTSNSEAGFDEIIIHSISGVEIKRMVYNHTTQAAINVADLTNGIYLIDIINGTNKQIKKIIIQR